VTLRRLTQLVRAKPGHNPTLRTGQLDNRDLESIISGIVKREGWGGDRRRIVVEVGTGSGRGSTVAIHRALTMTGPQFQLVGYEGDAELASRALERWSNAPDVRVVGEYFMRREDLDLAVNPRVAPGDRDSYLPEFEAVAAKENFLQTAPPGPIDLLFIDSVRYTHIAILRAAVEWVGPETVIVMEDDIPGYGELAIVESEFELRDVSRHELAGHPWPLVEFKLS
jgi:hypothetical protein